MNDEDYEKILKNIDQNNGYRIEYDILYKVKDDKKLKVIRRYELEGVMQLMHDHPTAAHFGIESTYNRIKERYWWKGMRKDIEAYVKTCKQCQMRGKPRGDNELHPIGVKEPFYQIGIDFVGPLPITQKGNRYIIVAMDYFTKWPEARAVKEANAKETAEFIMDDIICRHGCPKRILSDRGSHFNNDLIAKLTKKFEIKHNFSTPYHPQTNGLVERFNKTLCESLAKLTTKDEEWDSHISSVLMAYRTKIHDSTKMKPFYLVYGREARYINDQSDDITVNERIMKLIDILPEERYQAKQQISKSQEQQKKYHDQRVKVKEKYEIGDKVLYYKASRDKQWSGKLEEEWKGPYYIHEVLLNGSYKLKELNGKVLKVPVAGKLLKRYFSRENFEPIVVIT